MNEICKVANVTAVSSIYTRSKGRLKTIIERILSVDTISSFSSKDNIGSI